jgi:hypothetical protein
MMLAQLRKNGLSQNALSGIFNLTGSILQFSVERGYRSDNPRAARLGRLVERPRAKNQTEARVLDADEISRLIGASLPGSPGRLLPHSRTRGFVSRRLSVWSLGRRRFRGGGSARH